MKIYLPAGLSMLMLSMTTALAQNTRCVPLEITTLSNSGREVNKISYSYNAKRDITEIRKVTDHGGTPSVIEVKNFYDNQNKLIRTEDYFNAKLTYNTLLEYDNLGNKTLERKSLSNSLSSINELKGNISDVVNYAEDGSVISRTTTEKSDTKEVKTVFNNKQEILSEEAVVYHPDGRKEFYHFLEPKINLIREIKFEYNSQGLLVRELHSYNSKITLTIETTYQGINRLQQKGILPNGREEFRTEYKYSNNLESEILHYAQGKLFTKTEKKYDSHGNLLEEILSNNQGQILNSTFYKYECE